MDESSPGRADRIGTAHQKRAARQGGHTVIIKHGDVAIPSPNVLRYALSTKSIDPVMHIKLMLGGGEKRLVCTVGAMLLYGGTAPGEGVLVDLRLDFLGAIAHKDRAAGYAGTHLAAVTLYYQALVLSPPSAAH